MDKKTYNQKQQKIHQFTITVAVNIKQLSKHLQSIKIMHVMAATVCRLFMTFSPIQFSQAKGQYHLTIDDLRTANVNVCMYSMSDI